MNGIINVMKPPGMTSSNVVVYLRRNLKVKKVGHTGTLDPEASGVLPVCLGKATRIADYIMHGDKVYRCTMKLGITTDTADLAGSVISRTDQLPDVEKIIHALSVFQGELEQIPPMYSAIKVKGKKLYELARQGIEIERKPRKIQIYQNKFLAFYPPDEVLFETACSKGTYIRALCRDIGDFLSCGAAMSTLVRMASGNFFMAQSHSLEEIMEAYDQGKHEDLVIPMEKALESIMPSITLDEACREKISHGNKVGAANIVGRSESISPNQHCSIFCGNTFMGIGYLTDYGSRQIVQMKCVLI